MSDLQFKKKAKGAPREKAESRNGHQNTHWVDKIYVELPLNLLPKIPSQSPLLDSRAGSLGVCTHSLGGMKPSLAGLAASGGLEKKGVDIVPGYNLCAGSLRIEASFASIVGVGVGVAVDAHGVADVAVAGVAC